MTQDRDGGHLPRPMNERRRPALARIPGLPSMMSGSPVYCSFAMVRLDRDTPQDRLVRRGVTDRGHKVDQSATRSTQRVKPSNSPLAQSIDCLMVWPETSRLT